MAEIAPTQDERLAAVWTRVVHRGQVNDGDAGEILTRRVVTQDSHLCHEIATLTRELCESTKCFVLDARLPEIAENELSDATERLSYVVSTTEQAANLTLSVVEDGPPLANPLRSGAYRRSERWAGVRPRRPA